MPQDAPSPLPPGRGSRFLACPSALATARAVREGKTTARAVIEECLARIAALEAEVQAWAHLDPGLARSRADALDGAGASGPLAGVPVGLKDIIDTADMPTENGSALDAGRRPGRDAALAARLRSAGAIFPGKLVTTEYAFYAPAKTRNPHDLARTPGGSSSGSAAAVACGMLPLAIGTQTVGSVIRPAAFCGVFAMKPSHGTIAMAGIQPFAPSLDTAGVFARGLGDIALALDLLAEGEPLALGALANSATKAPRLAFIKTPFWDALDAGIGALFEDAARRLDAAPLDLPADLFADATATHRTILAHEARQALGPVLERGQAQLPPVLVDLLQEGERVKTPRYREAQRKAKAMRAAFGHAMAGFDAAITPAGRGEAPARASTGDPLFCLTWTLLGAPTLNLPALTGPSGLPLGLQVVAPTGCDRDAFCAARAIARALALGGD